MNLDSHAFHDPATAAEGTKRRGAGTASTSVSKCTRPRLRFVLLSSIATALGSIAAIAGGPTGSSSSVASFDLPTRLDINGSTTVGGLIQLRAARTHTSPPTPGDRPCVLDLRALHFSVAFDGGIAATLAQSLPGPLPAITTAETKLELAFPAIRAGRWSVGLLGPQQPASENHSCSVAPKDGVTELELEIETTLGIVRAKFAPEVAPAACLWVAKLAAEKRYDDRDIERVIRGTLVQIGSIDPARAPLEGSVTIPLDPSPRKHVRGALSLFRPGEASEEIKNPKRYPTGNGSFFVCLSEQAWMDGRYCVFGEVTAGLEHLDALGKAALLPTKNGELSRPKEAARVVAVRLVPANPSSVSK